MHQQQQSRSPASRSFSTLPFSLLLLSLLLLCSPTSTSAQPVGEDTATSAEYAKDDAFRDAVLNVTNTYREQHNATKLEWNKTLAEFAGDWSDDCKFKHSGGPYGENLASGYPNASASIIAWGQERTKYNFRKGDFSAETGHFTQLVWKNTTQVGCSRKQCNGGEKDGHGDAPGWYVVCEYSPAGNMIGSFVDNVQPQVSGSTEKCPQGAVCSAAHTLRGSVGALWIAVLVSCVAVAWM
ncbi:PR-1-like protein [Cucurbitaria berberidis CBS 394.84]|uniref:PR-1-like protein n=1 Tax=Cucurbitaria berberidis CBS 394.84 TaxID=1168544 RepID=A0A9P4GHH3_9PLEO|nr:PR-1-like protein [Cucurbitaria berberidis CBS 394.84]KAF1845549.1 PR-1-like protein [Cucurbitaria berberidis CBS 394.84]